MMSPSVTATLTITIPVVSNKRHVSTNQTLLGSQDERVIINLGVRSICGVGHITKNSTNVFSACRKRRLRKTGRGDWESPPLQNFPQRQHERRGVAGRLTSPRTLVTMSYNERGASKTC